MRKLTALLVAAGLAACTPRGDGVVYGFVTDSSSGARMQGVQVELQGHTVETNANGEFTLEGMPEGEAVLKVTKEGYAPAFTSVAPGKEGPVGAILTLKAQGTLQAYDATEEATLTQLTEAGPYAVILQPGSLDTGDTQLRVSVTPVDPTKEIAVLPGRLETQNAMLVPLTFADFTIYDGSGNPVNLKPGKEAVVELPIPAELRGLPQYAEGTTIHCYSYNPKTGQWEDFVVGQVVKSSVDGTTPVVRASLKHFSWYGAAPESNDCVDVIVQVVGADGKPLQGYTVEAFPGSKGTTDAQGYATVRAVPDGKTRIVATRTYIDTDGSVSGMKGAKVIDIGQVDTELWGLAKKACSGSGLRAAGSVRAMADGSEPPGSQANPVKVSVGPAGPLSYTAVAFMSLDSGAAGQGSLLVMLDEAPTEETSGDPVAGARITLQERAPGADASAPPVVQTYTLAGYPDVPGMYTLDLTVRAGARYTLSIDADANGSVDGTGTVVAPGEVSWVSPTEGASLSTSSFVARWTSTAGSGSGVLYWASVENVDDTSTGDVSFYSGTAMEFTPTRLDWMNPGSTGQRLSPGPYLARVSSFAGPWPVFGTNFSQPFTYTHNITGSVVGGDFYAFGPEAQVSFTLTP